MTWRTIDVVAVTFDEPVKVEPDALRLLDSTDSDVPLLVGGFTYDPTTRTAQWVLASGLHPGEFLISLDSPRIRDGGDAELDGEWVTSVDTIATAGDGNPGGDFHFRFNYLPGDVNRSGQTDAADRDLIQSAGNVVPNQSNYLLDVTASYRINNGDANYVGKLGMLNLDDFAEPTVAPASSDWGTRVDRVFADLESARQRPFEMPKHIHPRNINTNLENDETWIWPFGDDSSRLVSVTGL
jgi:hypothetical protein